MDPRRFDRWSKAVASSLTRREAVGGAGVAGLLAALMPWRGGNLAAAQAERTTCTYEMEAAIAVGRGARNQTRMIAGELRITIEPDGAIDDGVLIDADGAESQVVGQATGRAINLRISLTMTRCSSRSALQKTTCATAMAR